MKLNRSIQWYTWNNVSFDKNTESFTLERYTNKHNQVFLDKGIHFSRAIYKPKDWASQKKKNNFTLQSVWSSWSSYKPTSAHCSAPQTRQLFLQAPWRRTSSAVPTPQQTEAAAQTCWRHMQRSTTLGELSVFYTAWLPQVLCLHKRQISTLQDTAEKVKTVAVRPHEESMPV